MKNAVKGIAMGLAAAMILSLAAACGNTGTTSGPTPVPKPPEPLAPYSSTVTIHVGREANAGGQFAPGENSSSNSWIRMLKDQLNIDFVVDFDVVGGQYDQAVMLRAASDTLPDTFFINNSAGSYTLFKSLVAAGKLADLTSAYNNVGGLTKNYLAQTDTKDLLKYMTVNGKIYGIGAGNEGYNTAMMWVRQDWLDAVGMSVPKTVDDVANVAKAFVAQKPGGQANTIGICFNPDTNNGIFGQWFGLLPVFNAFGSYPDIWIDDGKGGAMYGAIQPETKTALQTLAQWTQDGIFDKAMFTMKNGDETRDTFVSTNACGIIFNAWWDPWVSWSGYGAASVNQNPNTVWVPALAPLNSNNQFSPKKETVAPGGQVVLAKCANPEAVVKAMNFIDEVSLLRNPTYKAVYDQYLKPLEGISGQRECSPIKQGSLLPNNNRILLAQAINDYKKTGTLTLDPRIEGNRNDLEGAYRYATANDMSKWYETPFDKQTDDNKAYFQYEFVGHWAFDVVGNLYLDGQNNKVFVEKPIAFNGQTESFSQYGDALRDLTNSTFQQIMSGDKPISAFDDYVAAWKSGGGDVLTKEVNDLMKAK
ncbi:MAG: extracellular solute-binding protein [Firmicutes bacterium]|nr:extracellular solute-binding protein [Bacillota bacterium]